MMFRNTVSQGESHEETWKGDSFGMRLVRFGRLGDHHESMETVFM